MDYKELLSKLLVEKEKLEHAIAAVTALVKDKPMPKRGRPPVSPASVSAMTHVPRKRKPFSAATKRKMSLAQKRRHAERKTAEAKAQRLRSHVLESMAEHPSHQEQVQFLLRVQRLFKEGLVTATYKYALLLALADIAVESGGDTRASLEVQISRIAEKYIS